jgi:2,3-bisphosphoglycerate-dependent phosphoglycerate mutase
MDKYGAEQVQIWRRSYDSPPPGGESLHMTAQRTIPYFEQTIVPYLEKNQTIFLVAHGNSLRAIIMKIEGLTPDEVVNLELATGHPLIYHFEKGQFIKQSGSL